MAAAAQPHQQMWAVDPRVAAAVRWEGGLRGRARGKHAGKHAGRTRGADEMSAAQTRGPAHMAFKLKSLERRFLAHVRDLPLAQTMAVRFAEICVQFALPCAQTRRIYMVNERAVNERAVKRN